MHGHAVTIGMAFSGIGITNYAPALAGEFAQAKTKFPVG